MGISTVPHELRLLQGLTASSLYHLHVAPLILKSSSIALCPFAYAEQRRILHWWGRCRSSDWNSQLDVRLPSSRATWNRVFLYKYARGIRWQPSWYRDLNQDQEKQRAAWGPRCGPCGKACDDGLPSCKTKGSTPNKNYPTEQERIDQEFEDFKKVIDADPYGMLFGRRLRPFSFGRGEGSWSSFCRSFFRLDDVAAAPPKKDVKVRGAKETTNSDMVLADEPTVSIHAGSDVAFEFDPISGRMVPTKGSSADQLQSNIPQTAQVEGADIPVNPYYARPPESGLRDFKEQHAAVPGSVEGKPSILTNEAQHHISQEETGTRININANPIPTAKPTLEATAGNGERGDVWLLGGPTQDAAVQPPSQSEPNSLFGGLRTQTGTGVGGETSRSPDNRPSPGEQHISVTNTASMSRFRHHLFSGLREFLPSKFQPSEEADGERPSAKFLFSRGNQTSGVTPSYDPPPSRPRHLEDSKNGDLDLLRARDIRASFGHNRAKQAFEREKRESRQVLERNFNSHQDAEGEIDVSKLRSRSRDEGSSQLAVNTEPPAAEPQHVELPATLGATGRGCFATSAGGDRNLEALQNANEGKVKAEVAEVEVTEELPTDSEVDTRLAREIRAIYEDMYGKIAFRHRQSQAKDVVCVSHQNPPETTSTETENSPPNEPMPVSQYCDADRTLIQSGVTTKATTSRSSDQENEIDKLLSNVRNFNDSARSLLTELREATQKLLTANQSNLSPAASLPCGPAQSTTLPAFPVRYRVLAYDPSALKVKEADITSSAYPPTSAPFLPIDAISRLNNPSKFLEFFPGLQAEGYEIVAGGGDILVFKKMIKATNTSSHLREVSATVPKAGPHGDSPIEAAFLEQEPTDLGQASSKRSESLPAFPPSQPASPPRSVMVRRQETVFTGGPPNWSPYVPESQGQHSRQQSAASAEASKRENLLFLRKMVRGVFLTGIVTAASCYALGVVAEYFRTGGQDGKGPRGFTGLEGR